MSITFWAPDAPTIKVKPYAYDPDFEDEQSTLPELRLSSSSACALLRLLDIEPDDCGTIELSDMPTLMSRLLVLGNSESARASELHGPTKEQSVRVEQSGNVAQIVRGPRMFGGGLADQQLQRYALTLLALLSQADEAKYSVSWG